MNTCNWDFYVTNFMYLLKKQMRGFSVPAMLCMAMAGLIIVFLYRFIASKVWNKKSTKKDVIADIGIALYISFILQVTIVRRDAGTNYAIRTDLNFGSLTGGYLAAQQFVYCFLNTLFFIPFGALAALRRSEKDSFIVKELIMVMLSSFLMSFLIESLQHLTGTGYFELSDIVLNTAGGEIGGMLCILIGKMIRKK